MRGLVMAALHCDFDQALQLCAKSDNLTKRFNEDSTNMTHLSNLLKQFKQLNTHPQPVGNVMGGSYVSSESSTKKQIEYIANLNSRVYNLVKNPYLKLFFMIMIESRTVSIKELFQQFIEKNVINLFDLITLACKFLNDGDLK